MAKEFLGVGWKYPVGTDLDGKIALSQYDEDIEAPGAGSQGRAVARQISDSCRQWHGDPLS